MKPRVNGVSFGVCEPSPSTTDRPWLLHACATLGFSCVRQGCAWDKVEPEPGVFNWEKADAAVNASRDAGLSIYMNPGGAPAWASEGKPTYVSAYPLMTDSPGCVTWVRPYVLGGEMIRFAEERDYCADPAHIDPAATKAFAVALATRYKDVVRWWGFGNEPGFSLFWPPSHLDPRDWTRLTNEVIAPFTEGIRSVIPKAIMVGPEAEDWGTLASILEIEKKAGARWFDIISFHAYSWDGTFPTGALKRLDDEFLKVAEEYRDGREVWQSEINGGGTPEKIEYMREVAKRKITNCIWLEPENFFDQYDTEGGGLTQFVPNALGRATQKMLTPKWRRRRAVRPQGEP